MGPLERRERDHRPHALDALVVTRQYSAAGVEIEHAPPAGAKRTERQVSSSEVPAEFQFERAAGPLSLRDFELSGKCLGEGAFGRVHRCIHKGSGGVLKQMAFHEPSMNLP